MGVDLHRIGTGISSGKSRNGFGNIVSFPSVPAGFPAAGSYNSTLDDVEYPVANGGTEVLLNSAAGNYFFPNQTCDVVVKNNGSGGTYTDWTTATDVQYKPYGLFIATLSSDLQVALSGQCAGSVNVIVGTLNQDFFHDGTGGNQLLGSSNNWLPYETLVFSENCDDGTGNYIDYFYYSDGNGGYYNG